MSDLLDRIRGALIGLRMPRALEALDHTLSRLERGELTAIEAIAGLLGDAHSTSSGHPFHEHPAGHSMNIRPPS